MSDFICGYIITARPKEKKDSGHVGQGSMAYGTNKDPARDCLLFDRGATIFLSEESARQALKASLTKAEQNGHTWPAMLLFQFDQVRTAPECGYTLRIT